MRLDLSTFTKHPGALGLIPLFVGLLLVIRGLPVFYVYRNVVAPAERVPLVLFASTGLPLIVVITTLGLADGYVSSQTAAALVTAGMLSVLFLPAVGLHLLRRAGVSESVAE